MRIRARSPEVREWLQGCAKAENRSPALRHYDPDAIVWAANAVGGGVLGNIAYDLLKKAYSQRSASETDPGKTLNLEAGFLHLLNKGMVQVSDEYLVQLVRRAVVEQRRRLKLRVPRNENLRISSWEKTYVGNRLVLRATVLSDADPSFEATVWVPNLDLATLGVNVQMRQATMLTPRPWWKIWLR